MANNPSATDNLKAALADIQQPPLPDEFYIAPGWLCLAVMVISALLWLGRRAYQRYQGDNARRLALKALAEISLQHPAAANAILQLVKQYLQTKQPGHPALAFRSAEFVVFLKNTGNLTLELPDLERLLYAGQSDPALLQNWQQFVRLWLQQHREARLYV
jgi:hypothetical protein